MAIIEDFNSPALIGQIAIASAALERSIDQGIVACLPRLSVEHQTILLSRLSFRQRLDMLHELLLSVVDEDERAVVTTWRRRVAKLWASSIRMLARERLAEGMLDGHKASHVIRRLLLEQTFLKDRNAVFASAKARAACEHVG